MSICAFCAWKFLERARMESTLRGGGGKAEDGCTISGDEDGGRGNENDDDDDDPVAAPQLALILVNPRLSNLHPFVLRSGRQAARRLSPRFTTGIFRVSSQGTGTGIGKREQNDDSTQSFHVNFTRDCRSFRPQRPRKYRSTRGKISNVE